MTKYICTHEIIVQRRCMQIPAEYACAKITWHTPTHSAWSGKFSITEKTSVDNDQTSAYSCIFCDAIHIEAIKEMISYHDQNPS